ncbi:post-transcriptional regulator [Alkalibacterium sp. f15]|uniref:post-transcriptional regulator n=1 Tax=Alkalibacterium sp. f15 TaxID=3414029 RepID=UPI003BF8A8E7
MDVTSNGFYLYDVWLKKKLNEFRKHGYNQVSLDDLWEYCIDFMWKHHKPERYYQEVNDIMSINSNDYFNFASLKAQVYNVSSLDEMELDDILG